MYRNKQFWDWKHFMENLALRFRKPTSEESPMVHSQITSILALLQKMQENHSVMSKQCDKIQLSTSSISNLTSLPPTTIQEVTVDDATMVVSGEIASSLADGNSGTADNSELPLEMFDTSIDTNLLLAQTDHALEDEDSGDADKLFDGSSQSYLPGLLSHTATTDSFPSPLDNQEVVEQTYFVPNEIIFVETAQITRNEVIASVITQPVFRGARKLGNNCFQHIGQCLVDNAVVESLWERSDLLIFDGIRFMHDHISIHLPFDPGDSVSPQISFECGLKQFGMLRLCKGTRLKLETDDVISRIGYEASMPEQIAHPNAGIFNVFNGYLSENEVRWNVVSFSTMLYCFVHKHLVLSDMTKLEVNINTDSTETILGKAVVKGMMTKFSPLQWVTYYNGIRNLTCLNLGNWEDLAIFTRALEHTTNLIFNVYEVLGIASLLVGGTTVIQTELDDPKWKESSHIYCVHMPSNVMSTIEDDNFIGATLVDGWLVNFD